MSHLILVVSVAALLCAAHMLRRRARSSQRRTRKWILFSAAGLSALSALAVLAAWSYLLWYDHRPQPEATSRALFEGVTYRRDVRTTPRPVVIHVVTVDLTAAGVELLVTPPDSPNSRRPMRARTTSRRVAQPPPAGGTNRPMRARTTSRRVAQPPPAGGTNRPMRARTTSRFLKEFGAQVAINGDCFDPCRSDGIFDFYPHTGDPVVALGNAASRGQVYSYGRRKDLTLCVSPDNRVRFGAPGDDAYNAISGTHRILRHGKAPRDLPGTIHPRTAVAADRSGKKLLLFVVDGRQPNYSEGVTLDELAGIVVAYGGYDAINLDGGGSSTLVVQDASGRPTALNSPIHTGIPGRERPVANHPGVFARPIGK